MGNRVGLARTQALIENLKRELQMNGSSLSGVKDGVVALTADKTLTALDSGRIITIDCTSTGVDVTLPAAAKGLYYKFVVVENTPSNAATIVATSTLCFGSVLADFNGTLSVVANTTPGTGFTTATITVTTEQGSYLEYRCDGTNWYVNGSGTDASAIWVAYS